MPILPSLAGAAENDLDINEIDLDVACMMEINSSQIESDMACTTDIDLDMASPRSFGRAHDRATAAFTYAELGASFKEHSAYPFLVTQLHTLQQKLRLLNAGCISLKETLDTKFFMLSERIAALEERGSLLKERERVLANKDSALATDGQRLAEAQCHAPKHHEFEDVFSEGDRLSKFSHAKPTDPADPVSSAIDHLNMSFRALGQVIMPQPRVQAFDGFWQRQSDGVVVCEIHGGILSWSDSLHRPPCVLSGQLLGDSIRMYLNGSTHTGIMHADDLTNTIMIEWSFGEVWEQFIGANFDGVDESATDTVKRDIRKVWTGMWRQTLPFSRQLDTFPSRRANRCRMCATMVLLLSMFFYIAFGFLKTTAPRKFMSVIKEEEYWADGHEQLPNLYLEWVLKPPNTNVTATWYSYTNGDLLQQSLDLTPCSVQQQNRFIENALCFPANLNIIGAYGDEVYQFLQIDVSVNTNAGVWANKTVQERQKLRADYEGRLAIICQRRDTVYTDILRSQLYSFTLGSPVHLKQELFFDRVKVRNGTWLGVVEALGMEDSWMDEYTYTNFHSEYTRYSKLTCKYDEGDTCVIMSFFLRSSLSSTIDTYDRHSIVNVFERVGAMFTSFAAFVALILLSILGGTRLIRNCCVRRKYLVKRARERQLALSNSQ